MSKSQPSDAYGRSGEEAGMIDPGPIDTFSAQLVAELSVLVQIDRIPSDRCADVEQMSRDLIEDCMQEIVVAAPSADGSVSLRIGMTRGLRRELARRAFDRGLLPLRQ